MMELESGELTRPTRIDLVAAEAVDTSLEHAERDLLRLRADAREAVAKAHELEARLIEESVDVESATWMMMRFQAFVGRLWSEAEAELDAVRAAAAREAARIRARATTPALSFRGALGAASSVWFDDLAERAISDAEQWLSWSSPSPASAPASPPADARPAPVSTAADEEPTPEPAPVVVEQTPAPDAPAHPAGDVEAFAELGALDAADDAHADAEPSPFWTEEKTDRWWKRRRPSKATVLQSGAVGALAIAACVHFL
jgi:hypothetical protein